MTQVRIKESITFKMIFLTNIMKTVHIVGNPSETTSQGTTTQQSSSQQTSTQQQTTTQQSSSQQTTTQQSSSQQTTTQQGTSTDQSSTEQSSSSQPPPNDGVCREEGFIGDDKDCHKFYRCVDNGKGGLTRYEFSCAEGTAWSTELTTCDYEENVNCSSSGNTTQAPPPCNTTESSTTTESTTRKILTVICCYICETASSNSIENQLLVQFN